MNKEYYTLGKIITSLRKPYQESVLLLNEINKNIEIESDEPYNIELSLLLKEIIIPKRLIREQQLLLNVKRVNRKAIIRKIISNYLDNELYLKDNATFELREDNNYYRFRQHSNNFKDYYQPKVYIPSNLQSEFLKKYIKLKESTLYSLPQLDKYITPIQRIYINGSIICYKDDSGITLYYSAKDDKIHLESEKRYSNTIIEELLLTKIPSSILEEEHINYLNLIDNYDNEIIFENNFRKRKETITIIEEPKKLILKK